MTKGPGAHIFRSHATVVESDSREVRFSTWSLVGLGLTSLAVGPARGLAEEKKPMMKAVVIHAYGGTNVLKFEDLPRPEPKDDEVLIRVIAASINPVDAAIRQGYLAQL